MKTGAMAAAAGAEVRRIGAAEFKAHCLQLMDEVQRTRRAMVITKRGRPVAQLAPWGSAPVRLHGAMRGQLTECGDIVGPILEPWNAEQ